MNTMFFSLFNFTYAVKLSERSVQKLKTIMKKSHDPLSCISHLVYELLFSSDQIWLWIAEFT